MGRKGGIENGRCGEYSRERRARDQGKENGMGVNRGGEKGGEWLAGDGGGKRGDGCDGNVFRSDKNLGMINARNEKAIDVWPINLAGNETHHAENLLS